MPASKNNVMDQDTYFDMPSRYLEEHKRHHFDGIASHFDALAHERALWLEKNSNFYARELKTLHDLVPHDASVLEVGCGNGDMLSRLKAKRVVGVDISPEMISVARLRHPGIEFFCANIEDEDQLRQIGGPFDYIILSDVLGYAYDFHTCLNALAHLMHARTRVVVTYYNRWWEPLIKLWVRAGRAMPRPKQNWFSESDIRSISELADFEVIKFVRRELVPMRLFGIGSFVNRFIAPLPLVNRLCWRSYIVLRANRKAPEAKPSVTVLIPCRNEAGNIESCVQRTPDMGAFTELLFVEGNSSDGTYERCLEVAAAYPHRNIRVLKQRSKGKGEAVHLGFKEAKGDIVMILDSDLTVPPEYLPRVYDAIASGRADFVNCSRLIYPMAKNAMRPLNYVANRMFARVFSYLVDQPLSDTLCGTKALYKDDYLKIEETRQREGSYDPFGDFDLIFGAARLNLKIVEMPVRYHARLYGETQIARFADGWMLLKMVAKAYLKLKTR